VLWVQLGHHADEGCEELFSALPSVYSAPVHKDGQVEQGDDQVGKTLRVLVEILGGSWWYKSDGRVARQHTNCFSPLLFFLEF
jgi:hypothetical protein